MKKTSQALLKRVSHLQTQDSSEHIYDDWSNDYDADLIEEFGYISPRVSAQVLSREISDRNIKIMDYGCGTGLVGAALDAAGFRGIDGVDISAGMLKKAADKNIYRKLSQLDLTAPTNLPDNHYDAAMCIGSMGAGHVGARHIPELLRAIKPGGLFVIIINSSYYQSEGFDRAVEEMQTQGLWKIRSMQNLNYMDALDRPGMLLLAECL
ncbi:MAG: methyltransferase domain-containing protein [Pseudomonadota bacterium]